jgi:hypothetical protein
MPALDQGTAVMLLGGLTGTSSFVATATGLKLRLTINAPTATVNGTQLSGSGYSAGGQAVTWSAATGTATGAIITNTNTITWTNGGGSNWTIVGLELWDQGGTPARKLFGLWNGQPYTVGPGSQFVVSANSLSLTFP